MLTPLVAALESGSGSIAFKHAGAAIKVTINNLPKGAHSIGMTVDGQQVSGWYNVNPANAGADAVVPNSADATQNSIWLNYTNEAESAWDFIFPVPALTAPKLSFQIYDKNDVLVWSANLKAQSDDLGRADLLVLNAPNITPYKQFDKMSDTWTIIGTFNDTAWGADFPMVTDGNLCIAKGLTFAAGGEFKVRKDLSWGESWGADANNNYQVNEAGTYDVIFNSTTHAISVVNSSSFQYPTTPLKQLEVDIKTVWLKTSSGSAWNTYYGGTAGSDRNIAMDDEYVYIAENTGTAKLWAISISDPTDVKAVNVTGVSGGTHLLACPRVVKNTDSSINGGKDVLICSNLTRGGVTPKLYIWNNGIDSAPRAITLTTWAEGAWYGDVFTVYGTLQNGELLFDKIGGDDANGVVSFILNGLPDSNLNLVSRIKFNDAMGSHNGACAYYPFPGDLNHGIYSPGRGVEARGKSVSFDGNLNGGGGFDPTLTNLEYADGRNGYVLGFNFIEWHGKRYVIYGKQPDASNGYVYVLEGAANATWLDIANTAGVKFRRDLAASGFTSSNSGMDVTARVINGELYFAAQKQNVACGVYKLVYE